MIKYNNEKSRARVRALVFAVSEATTKTGKPYCKLDLINEDYSHTPVNVWQSTADAFKVNQVFYGIVDVNDQGASISFKGCTLEECGESDPLYAVRPAPPTKTEWALVVADCIRTCSEEHQKVVTAFADELYASYCQGTAAKSNHHNFKGGLALHTYEMLKLFSSLKEALPFKVDAFVVTVSVLYHDWGKLLEYNVEDSISYTPAISLQGHPFLSAEHAKTVLQQFECVTPHDIQHIQHCILAHHGRLEWGSPVRPATAEAFLVHHLDMLSGMGTAFKQTANGEKSWCLETTVYKYGED